FVCCSIRRFILLRDGSQVSTFANAGSALRPGRRPSTRSTSALRQRAYDRITPGAVTRKRRSTMTIRDGVRAFAFAFAAGPLLAQPGTAPSAAPQSKEWTPGQTFKECRNCPEMIVLPAGTFTMGSPSDDPMRRDSEVQHEITFERPFAMSTTPVTWNQWEACVRDGWCDGIAVETALATLPNGERNPNHQDRGRGTRPVVGVSWYDAQAFVGWLNAKTGEDDAYRLPSEAEWEYGARA